MIENPYTPPEMASEGLPRTRIRFGFGNILFLGLGFAFVLLPASAVTWAISDARTVSIGVGTGVAVMITLGMLLIAHGALRSNATIGLVSFVLFAIVFLIVAAVTIGALF